MSDGLSKPRTSKREAFWVWWYGLPELERAINLVRKGECPRHCGTLQAGWCKDCHRRYSARIAGFEQTLRVETLLTTMELHISEEAPRRWWPGS